MSNSISIFQSDSIYHLYNRANGQEKLFSTADNYVFFLKKYQQYIYPIADTFCYCLMPNHFHFLIRIKLEDVLKEVFKDKIEKKVEQGKLQGFQNLIEKEITSNQSGFENLTGLYSSLISRQFSNFFNSCSKAFNKENNRRGALFMRPFKRKQVKSERYFRKLVHYNTLQSHCGRINRWVQLEIFLL